MFYTSSLLLINTYGAVDDLDVKYRGLVAQGLQRTMKNGGFDMLITTEITSEKELEIVLMKLYQVSLEEKQKLGKEFIDVRVILSGYSTFRDHCWEAVFVAKTESYLMEEFRYDYGSFSIPAVILQTDPSFEASNAESEKDYTDQMQDLQLNAYTAEQFDCSALGGTFDHLHDGHKILLTVAGFVTRTRLIIGLTGESLLKNKKYAEAMEPYSVRESNIRKFLSYLFPSLYLYIVELNDIYGPTITEEHIQALVASKETYENSKKLNEFRVQKGWKEMEIIVIGLVGCSNDSKQEEWASKLSSTELRRRELERMKQGKQ